MCRAHPSGASRTQIEAVPGPPQFRIFQLPGLPRAKSKGLRGWRIGGLRIEVRGFATSSPLDHQFCGQVQNLRKIRRRAHPSGASGTEFEACSWARAVPGSNAFSDFAFYAWRIAD
eukprot:2684698-Alexandrium_andersonii.AAC.1